MSHMNTSQSNVAAFIKCFFFYFTIKAHQYHFLHFDIQKKLPVQTAYSAEDEDS
ncbi:hypothetical protein BSI_15330 [Bacillus inaquosorum KCTC 13429]|uniref:Uncharacterized protein n=1 Tax=Bacillus inaquosorum KCTC 13429 TaxID=1236548 RepID=A0A9W5LKJ7_9BACI|nr:hypothetical protein BSI_15330 [Bacillus inaquosorum KCTC 13429]